MLFKGKTSSCYSIMWWTISGLSLCLYSNTWQALNRYKITVLILPRFWSFSYRSSWLLYPLAHLSDRRQQRAERSQSSSDISLGPVSEWPSSHSQVLSSQPTLLLSVLDTQTDTCFYFGSISGLVLGLPLKMWKINFINPLGEIDLLHLTHRIYS